MNSTSKIHSRVIANNNPRIQRFKDASWFTPMEMPDVSIYGVGSLGSYLTFFLGRMDCKLYIYDYDKLEPLNSSAQFYPINECKAMKFKVDSLKSWLSDFIGNDLDITSNNEQITEEHSNVTPITFVCFDNMKARKIIFDKWSKLPHREIFIDMRANMEEFTVFVVKDDKSIQRYNDEFYSDESIPDLPCSMKSTSHCSAMCASIAIGLFTNYLSNKNSGEDIRDLPFSTKISIPLSLYETNY